MVERYRNSILSFRHRWTSWTRLTLMGMLCGHRSISSRLNSFSSKMIWVTLKRYKTMVEARNTSVITSPRLWVSLMPSRLILSWSLLTIPTSSSNLHREKMMFTGRPTWEVSHRQRSSSWWHLMSSLSSNNSNNITRWMSLRLMMARVAPRRKKMPLMLLTTHMLMRLN